MCQGCAGCGAPDWRGRLCLCSKSGRAREVQHIQCQCRTQQGHVIALLSTRLHQHLVHAHLWPRQVSSLFPSPLRSPPLLFSHVCNPPGYTWPLHLSFVSAAANSPYWHHDVPELLVYNIVKLCASLSSSFNFVVSVINPPTTRVLWLGAQDALSVVQALQSLTASCTRKIQFHLKARGATQAQLTPPAHPQVPPK